MNHCHLLRLLLVLAITLPLSSAANDHDLQGYTPQPGPDGAPCEPMLVCDRECVNGYTACQLVSCYGEVLGPEQIMQCDGVGRDDRPIIDFDNSPAIEERVIREYERRGGPAIDPADPDIDFHGGGEDPWRTIDPDAGRPRDLLPPDGRQPRWQFDQPPGGQFPRRLQWD